MTEYNFLYYLAAFGENNIDEKINILKHNLFYLYNNIQKKFDIMLNCYDNDTVKIESFLCSIPFLMKIIIHKKKGRLVELWKTNPYHTLIHNYDYILYILDDVKITNLDISQMIHIKNTYSIEFLSPKVLGGTWDYMRNQSDNILAFANKMELFCLLLNESDFNKFMDINDIENTYTWGVDMLLGHFKIKSAVYFKFVVNHMLPSETHGGKAGHYMHQYLNKHGFSTMDELGKQYPLAIYKTIEVYI
jgi:hypothetical protein